MTKGGEGFNEDMFLKNLQFLKTEEIVSNPIKWREEHTDLVITSSDSVLDREYPFKLEMN